MDSELIKVLLLKAVNALGERVQRSTLPLEEGNIGSASFKHFIVDSRDQKQYHFLSYAIVVEDKKHLDMYEVVTNLRKTKLNGYVTDTGLRLFLHSSYLMIKGYSPEYAKPLASLFEKKYVKLEQDEYRVNKDSAGFMEYVMPMMDIFEKFGMLFYHRDSIPDPQLDFSTVMGQIHFYGFVFASKALLDRIAVLLRDLFKLAAFQGGKIDLNLGSFKNAVSAYDTWPEIKPLFDDLSPWFDHVTQYRMNLIHRRRITVFLDASKNHFFIPYTFSGDTIYDPLMDAKTEDEAKNALSQLNRYYNMMDTIMDEWIANMEKLLQEVCKLVMMKLVSCP